MALTKVSRGLLSTGIVDNSTTTAITIDSSENVGIGTSSTYNMRTTIAGAGSALTTGTGSYAVASIYDTATAAAGTGGGLAFQGDDGTNSAVTFATVNGSKENATSGNYASYLGFSTRANGGNLTEKMRIDSSGNVGIGGSPNAWFSGWKAVQTSAASLYSQSAAAGGVQFNSYYDGNWRTQAAGYGGVMQFDASTGSLSFYNSTAATGAAGSAYALSGGRMTIDSSGRLLINTTSILTGSAAKLQVLQTVTDEWSQRINNSAASPNGLTISYTSASPNGTANHFLYCTDSTSARWGVYSNGGVLNYSGNNVNLSDRNAKKDITVHTDNEWNCVKAWEIVDYRYKDEADDSPAKIGVIAQQIQEHCPDLVKVFQEQADAVEEVLGEDGEVVTEAKAAVEKRIGVNEAQMMWKVTKALQEAMERIETLEAKVQTLENN